jgi:hypothetical protein
MSHPKVKLDGAYRSGEWAPLLDAAGATDRRDAFLETALTGLGT